MGREKNLVAVGRPGCVVWVETRNGNASGLTRGVDVGSQWNQVQFPESPRASPEKEQRFAVWRNSGIRVGEHWRRWRRQLSFVACVDRNDEERIRPPFAS